MNCKKCNTKVPENVKFCGQCGEKISDSDSITNKNRSSDSKKFFAFNAKVVAILGILVLLTPAKIAGLIIFCGALAYQSAKDRKLGVVRNSKMRTTLEIVTLILLSLILILPQGSFERNFEYPVSSGFLIFIWIVIAYIYLQLKEIISLAKKTEELKD